MGKMNELFRLLNNHVQHDNKKSKEELEDFFLNRGFNNHTVGIAVDEFTKAYNQLNIEKEQYDEQDNTKTRNTK
jgi:hypothetical protein